MDNTSSIVDEIYVVDDCSPDCCAFEFYKTLNPRIKVVLNTVNRGIAATKNWGLRLLSDCDIIFLADCDIVLKKGWDEFYVKRMVETNISSVSTCNVIDINHPNDTLVSAGHTIQYFKRFHGVLMAITKENLQKVGGFPLLPHPYGQEHYNWQIRVSRTGTLQKKGYVADFEGGNQYIEMMHASNTFITGREKEEQSIKNAKVSEQLLKKHNQFIPMHVEKKNNIGNKLCIIIGHRNSTPDRVLNLNAILNWYKSCLPETHIVVVEQDSHPALEGKLRKDVQYVFAHNKGSYNRSWAFNIVAKMVTHPVIACMDNDVILKRHTIEHAVMDKIVSGEFDFYKPYHKFLDLSEGLTEIFRNSFRMNWKDGDLPSRCDSNEWMAGGCMFARRKDFIEIGGYNEHFRGWGGEDDEFIHRSRKIKNVGRIVNGHLYDFNLYHLFHQRTQDCTENQPQYTNNVATMRVVEQMNPDQIRNYIRTDLLPDFGNLDKYKNE